MGGYGKFKNRSTYAGFGTLLRYFESIIINSYIQGQSYLKTKSTVGISQMFRTFSGHSGFLLGQSMYGILIDLRLISSFSLSIFPSVVLYGLFFTSWRKLIDRFFFKTLFKPVHPTGNPLKWFVIWASLHTFLFALFNSSSFSCCPSRGGGMN